MDERAHHCHASGCSTPCPPKHLMCLHHWRMVPDRAKRLIYRHYQLDQEMGEVTPTREWHLAADAAIGAVALKEGRRITQAQEDALVLVSPDDLNPEDVQLGLFANK